MSNPVYQVIVGESLPDLSLWVNVDGVLLGGLGSGHTFLLTVRDAADSTNLFTKSSGITGQTGRDRAPDGTPNIVIQWATTAELDALTAGRLHKASLQITRSSDSRVRYYPFAIRAVAPTG